MTKELKTMLVGRIDNQGDRILIYKSETPEISRFGEYYIIAAANCPVNVGDTIQYEPYGFNFGWFISIVNNLKLKGSE